MSRLCLPRIATSSSSSSSQVLKACLCVKVLKARPQGVRKTAQAAMERAGVHGGNPNQGGKHLHARAASTTSLLVGDSLGTQPEVPTPSNDFSHGETRLTREGRRRLRGDTGRCCNQYQRTGTGTDKLRLPRLECTACHSLKVSTAQTPSH